MSNGSIILVGGPASGKTNYIARLWLAFKARKGKLRAKHLPDNIEYVNEAVQHLLARKFAPRSERNMEEGGRRDFMIRVRGDDGTGSEQDLTVPDVTGELWARAIRSYELPQDWIDALKASSSAILFVRAHSKFNLQPMDWVTARDLLKAHEDEDDDDGEDDDEDYGDDEDEDGESIEAVAAETMQPTEQPEKPPMKEDQTKAGARDSAAGAVEPEDAYSSTSEGEEESDEFASKREGLPAQVGFCELLRYLSLLLSDRPDGSKPRIAVVITAWDMLDAKAKAAGPMQYLKNQFPMFAGRIGTPGRLEIETFGMSIVGGNLRGKANKVFRDSLKRRDLSEVGFTAVMRDGIVVEDPDVTLPLSWALGG